MAGTYSILRNIQILPENAVSAVEHSRRISVEDSGQLSSAFDYLRHAEIEIQILRDARQTDHRFLEEHSRRFGGFLELARQDLREAEQSFSMAAVADGGTRNRPNPDDGSTQA